MMQGKKVIIFGAGGMIGKEFVDQCRGLNCEIICPDRGECDITNFENVLNFISTHTADAIINCAGIVDLSACEENSELAQQVNAEGPGNIARALAQLQRATTSFLHISTCYVFGNEKNEYTEDDAPHPLNVYGKTKWEGEQKVATALENTGIKFFIIRTSWIYSEYKDTFVDMVVLSLKQGKKTDVVTDQFNTVTWAKDLTGACKSFILNPDIFKSGVYHISAQTENAVSKMEIARACAEACNLQSDLLIPALSAALLGHDRPRSAFLKTTRHILLPQWNVSLRAYLQQRYG